MSQYKIVGRGPIQDLSPYKIVGLASEQQDMQQPIESIPPKESVMSWLPKDILAGLMGLGRNVGGYTVSLTKGVENLADIGRKVFGNIPAPHPTLEAPDTPYSEQLQGLLNQAIPEDYAQKYGPKNQGLLDAMIQSGITHAPELAIGGGLARIAAPLVLRRAAAGPLNQAARMATERNIAPLNISRELIEDTRQFLPNTAPYRRLIDKAMTGDYHALFRLQSDLGRASREYARNPFSAAERHFGRAGGDLRHELLGEKARALEEAGHADIAEAQRLGQEQYRRYMQARPYIRGGALLLAQQTGMPSYLRKLLMGD